MYCQKCGRVIDENQNICSGCGELITTPVMNTQSNQWPSNSRPIHYSHTAVSPSNAKKKTNKGCIIGLIVFGIVFVFFLLIIFGGGEDALDNNVNTTISSNNNIQATEDDSNSTTINTSKSPIDINVLVAKTSAKKGEVNKIYRVDTKYRNADGSYNVINFQSIMYQRTFTSNNGTILKNVVVIENVPPIIQTRNFVANAAYWIAYDEFGEEFPVGDIYTQTGDELSEIIIDIPNSNGLKYLLVGGLDKQLYEAGKLVFEIQQ